jgi:ribonuclease Z
MTPMKLVFLGTGGSYPSKERNLACVALKMMNGEVILFDCAEGTQRQMMFTSISFMQVKCILLSHFHGDHFLGLPGLVQTMYLNERKDPLDIYGPPKTVRRIEGLLGTGHFNPTFALRVHDLEGGQVVERDGYKIRATWANHGVPDMAYSVEEDARPGKFDKPKALELGIPEGPLFGKLQRGETVTVKGQKFTPEMVMGPPRKGRKVVYTGDTAPCDAVEELAQNADALIHDSTGGTDIEEKMNEWGHTSSRQAAEIAKKANVKLLFLTHISPRYREEDSKTLLEDARAVFPQTYLAKDFYEHAIPYPE